MAGSGKSGKNIFIGKTGARNWNEPKYNVESYRKTITKKNANEKMHSGRQQSVLTVRWHFKWILPLVIPIHSPYILCSRHTIASTCNWCLSEDTLDLDPVARALFISGRHPLRLRVDLEFRDVCLNVVRPLAEQKRKWNYLLKKKTLKCPGQTRSKSDDGEGQRGRSGWNPFERNVKG